MKLAGLRTTAILVPSQATASDLARYLREGVLSRTHVVHHGCVRPDRPANEAELTGPFLVLGDDRPRKNLPRLQAAHALAQEKAGGAEGLAMGRRVLASSSGPLPEVLGEAGVLLPAQDQAAWTQAMMTAVRPRGAPEARACRQRAEHFSWDRSAARSLALWRQLSPDHS